MFSRPRDTNRFSRLLRVSFKSPALRNGPGVQLSPLGANRPRNYIQTTHSRQIVISATCFFRTPEAYFVKKLNVHGGTKRVDRSD